MEIAPEDDKGARTREKRVRIAFLAEKLPEIAEQASAEGCADLWALRMAGVSGAKKPNPWRQLGQMRKLCNWVADDEVGPAKVSELLALVAEKGYGGVDLKFLKGWNGNGGHRRRVSFDAGAPPNLEPGRYDHLPKGLYHESPETGNP